MTLPIGGGAPQDKTPKVGEFEKVTESGDLKSVSTNVTIGGKSYRITFRNPELMQRIQEAEGGKIPDDLKETAKDLVANTVATDVFESYSKVEFTGGKLKVDGQQIDDRLSELKKQHGEATKTKKDLGAVAEGTRTQEQKSQLEVATKSADALEKKLAQLQKLQASAKTINDIATRIITGTAIPAKVTLPVKTPLKKPEGPEGAPPEVTPNVIIEPTEVKTRPLRAVPTKSKLTRKDTAKHVSMPAGGHGPPTEHAGKRRPISKGTPSTVDKTKTLYTRPPAKEDTGGAPTPPNTARKPPTEEGDYGSIPGQPLPTQPAKATPPRTSASSPPKAPPLPESLATTTPPTTTPSVDKNEEIRRLAAEKAKKNRPAGAEPTVDGAGATPEPAKKTERTEDEKFLTAELQKKFAGARGDDEAEPEPMDVKKTVTDVDTEAEEKKTVADANTEEAETTAERPEGMAAVLRDIRNKKVQLQKAKGGRPEDIGTKADALKKEEEAKKGAFSDGTVNKMIEKAQSKGEEEVDKDTDEGD